MGGTVTIGVRRSNGEEYRMQRWTNSFPSFINDIRFFEEDEEHINEYISSWLDMKDDYEKNKQSGKFKYPMTEAYFPSEGLVPCDYGIVIFDFLKKEIISYQGYSSPGKISMPGLSLSLSGNILGEEEGKNEFDCAYELVKAGRVNLLSRQGNVTESGLSKDISKEEFADLVEDRENNYSFLLLDVSPFNLYGYQGFVEGRGFIDDLVGCYEHVKQNFTLSDEEKRIWEEAIQEHEEDEDE